MVIFNVRLQHGVRKEGIYVVIMVMPMSDSQYIQMSSSSPYLEAKDPLN